MKQSRKLSKPDECGACSGWAGREDVECACFSSFIFIFNFIFNTHKKRPPIGWPFYLALDGDLLSHGETPHYHRRCIVSLLSSERIQVVPMLYVRQAIQLRSRSAVRCVFSNSDR